MNQEQWQNLEKLLEKWVEEHPRRDEPTITYLGRNYSPQDLLEEVKEETELGEALGDFLYSASTKFGVSVDSFVNRAIEANNKEWPK